MQEKFGRILVPTEEVVEHNLRFLVHVDIIDDDHAGDLVVSHELDDVRGDLHIQQPTRA